MARVTILTASLSKCQMRRRNYVRAYWGTTRIHYICGANPSSYLWGPVCPTHPEGWFKPTLASKKFSQLQMNYCLKQDGMKHKWNTGSEVKIGPFLWMVSGQKSRKSWRWQDVFITVVSGVKNTGMTSRESVPED